MGTMTRGFFGEHAHTIDDKGRLSIPSDFREILQLQGSLDLILVPSLVEECIDAYPLSEWQKLEEKIAALPKYDKTAILLKKRLFGPARKCAIDKIGRVLVAQDLRRRVSLDRDVLVVGQLEKIQIWSSGVYAKLMDEKIDDRVFRELDI